MLHWRVRGKSLQPFEDRTLPQCCDFTSEVSSCDVREWSGALWWMMGFRARWFTRPAGHFVGVPAYCRPSRDMPFAASHFPSTMPHPSALEPSPAIPATPAGRVLAGVHRRPQPTPAEDRRAEFTRGWVPRRWGGFPPLSAPLLPAHEVEASLGGDSRMPVGT
jgi:hypothetical protein